MKPDDPPKIDAPDPVPDVWWGENGIDALIWVDPVPYELPSLKVPVSPALVMVEAGL
jgi:hypothetical protein